MLNTDNLHYTYIHRRAFIFVVNKIVRDEDDRGELFRRAQTHDVDKMLLYTLIPKEMASEYHRGHAKHHMENDIPKDIYDCMEAVIDYECAGFTKPNKPLNAYDTVIKYNKNNADRLIAIMEDWGIAHSYKNTPNDPDWLEYAKTIQEPTEKHYLSDIYRYIYQDPHTSSLAIQYARKVNIDQSILI